MKMRCDTYCGLYCGACDVFIANKEGLLEKKAQEWDMDPEDVKCHGCKTDTTAIYCRDCGIKLCAENKTVDFCFQCAEYPCPLIKEFRNDNHPHHSVIVENLDAIKKRGVEKWLDEQKIRWSCQECGTPFAWYDETCKTCGTSLYNCKEEEKDLRK